MRLNNFNYLIGNLLKNSSTSFTPSGVTQFDGSSISGSASPGTFLTGMSISTGTKVNNFNVCFSSDIQDIDVTSYTMTSLIDGFKMVSGTSSWITNGLACFQATITITNGTNENIELKSVGFIAQYTLIDIKNLDEALIIKPNESYTFTYSF